LAAYDAGASGQNVKVAVIDTGINPNLPEFIGRVDPASQDVAASRGIVDNQGHGSMVSGVIAANRDNSYMHGVAWRASIVSLNVYDPAGCKPGNDCFLDASIDEAIDLAVQSGAKIINMSFGDEEGMTAEVWPAIQRAVDAGVIMVLAAGNGGRANPNGFAQQNIQNNGGSGLFIIAGAMDAGRNIASFTDRAGTTNASTYYLTALGVGNATVNQFGTHVNPNGTSFAAPTIAGAAALLAGTFPNLTGAQIVNLLLTTADDAGATGTDAVFGRGIINIARAFQPQGQTKLAGSKQAISLSGNGFSSGPIGDAASRGGPGAIILDGYSRAYALDVAKTLARQPQDQPLRQGLEGHGFQSASLSAGPVSVSLTVRRNAAGSYRTSMEQTWLRSEEGERARTVAGLVVTKLTPKTALALGISQSGRTLQQRLTSQYGRAFLVAQDPLSRTGFQPSPGTSIGLRHQFARIGLTATSEQGKQWSWRPDPWNGRPGYAMHAVTLDARVGPASFNLGATQLRENRTMLGSSFGPSLSIGRSRTMFVDGSAEVALGRGWLASASYRRGWTNVSGTGQLVQGGRLGTQAFSADLSKSQIFADDDRLSFRFAQPLRVVNGGFDLYLPVSYDYGTGHASFENRFMGLSPRGRELDYELAYGRSMFGGYLDLNAFLRTDPGNVEAMRNDVGAAVRFNLRY
jgi:hypothetical protein